jgi:hypothetical protein
MKIPLPGGAYDMTVDYRGTQLQYAPPVATVEVKEGQDITQTVDLQLARVHIEVNDAPGQPNDGARVVAWAYPAGTRDSPFGSADGANPFDLIVRAGITYDVVVHLEGLQIELDDLTLEEGVIKVIQLSASDFK